MHIPPAFHDHRAAIEALEPFETGHSGVWTIHRYEGDSYTAHTTIGAAEIVIQNDRNGAGLSADVITANITCLDVAFALGMVSGATEAPYPHLTDDNELAAAHHGHRIPLTTFPGDTDREASINAMRLARALVDRARVLSQASRYQAVA